MVAREFDITIGKDGAVELHCKGFNGSSCLEAVKLFEKMAGEMKSQQPATGFAKGRGTGLSELPQATARQNTGANLPGWEVGPLKSSG